MGACLAQETAHKASLDSFLGNHDEVRLCSCVTVVLTYTCDSGYPGVGGSCEKQAITTDVHAAG